MEHSRICRRENVLHLKLFNPLDDHYGLSPLDRRRAALDPHNAASPWNKAMLDNAARPSGALVFRPAMAQLSLRPVRSVEGTSSNANFPGRCPMPGGPWCWKAGSTGRRWASRRKDMDFIDAKNQRGARDRAGPRGAAMLLGIPGDNTYRQLRRSQPRLLAPDGDPALYAA